MQRVISNDFNKYTESLPKQIAESLDLDFNRINDRKIAHYVDESIQQDKDLARKFNVRNFPTTVIFNESGNYNGVMLEGILAHDKLILPSETFTTDLNIYLHYLVNLFFENW